MYLCYESKWVEWITTLNPIEIFIAAILGIITGVLSSKIYAKQKEKDELKQLKKQFSQLNGTFNGPIHEKTNKLISKAEIRHIQKHQLTIEVTTFVDDNGNTLEQNQVWTGEITMNTIRIGILLFEYQEPKELTPRNGFKRIIVDNNYNAFTLIGEKTDGYYDEKFERV